MLVARDPRPPDPGPLRAMPRRRNVDKPSITTRMNGPYLVKGPVHLIDADGKEFTAHRRHHRALPLRALGQQAVLRRHAQQGRLPGRREGPLTRGAIEMGARHPDRRHVTRAADDADAIELCFARGWTDGLPVVPPTPERVERDARGRPPRARPRDHLRRPPGGLRHRREGRHQRRHGGVPARVHAGRRRGHRGHRRPALELPRAGHLDGRGRRPPDRQRAGGARAGRQRRRQPLRARLAGQPDDRARRAPGDAERLRLPARHPRPRNARSSRASSPT